MKTVKSISYQHLQLAPSCLQESDNWENEKQIFSSKLKQ